MVGHEDAEGTADTNGCRDTEGPDEIDGCEGGCRKEGPDDTLGFTLGCFEGWDEGIRDRLGGLLGLTEG